MLYTRYTIVVYTCIVFIFNHLLRSNKFNLKNEEAFQVMGVNRHTALIYNIYIICNNKKQTTQYNMLVEINYYIFYYY
jgi:hypothetical protein